jgi:hypothetical protein
VAFGKVYAAKVPVTAADLLNDRVLPFFEQQGVPVEGTRGGGRSSDNSVIKSYENGAC